MTEDLTFTGHEFHIPKNIFLILAALASFSLWLSSTLSAPKRLEEIERRLMSVEIAQGSFGAQLKNATEDIRDIKKILMEAHK